jgi:hypothetical protein
VAIVAVGLLYVFRSYSATIHALSAAESYYTASGILENTVGAIELGMIDAGTFSDSTVTVGSREYLIRIHDFDSGSYRASALGEDVVKVSVTWDDGGRQLSVPKVIGQ